MNRFLNLASRVINTSHIVEIVKKTNKYEIHMSNYQVNGALCLSTGILTSKQNVIEICSTENKHDYNIITLFIKDI